MTLTCMPPLSMVAVTRATWCDINLNALDRNTESISAMAGVPILPMVKANAYGHGMEAVVERLARHASVWGMGVALATEASWLRDLGYEGRIIILGGLLAEEAEEAIGAGAIVALSSLAVARALSGAASKAGVVCPVHLKVDIGMNRLGFPLAQVGEAAEEVAGSSGLRLEGVLTHLAAAHEGDQDSIGRTVGEVERFLELVEALRASHGNLLAHAANSSALMTLDRSRLDLARPGLALYGWKPSGWLPDEPLLIPVAAVRARVAVVKVTGEDALVGYSQTPVEPGRRIGVLPIGYGDGLPQAWGLAPGHAEFPSGRAPIIGSVCMDSCVVDLTGLPDEGEGSTALMLGTGAEGSITLDEMAGATNRSSYEILTGLTDRLPRIYKDS